MSIEELQKVVIECLRENLKLSGEEIPLITKNTKPACDLSGFDSLRTIEVLVALEEKIGCDLPPDKIFSAIKYEDATVSAITIAIDKVEKEASK